MSVQGRPRTDRVGVRLAACALALAVVAGAALAPSGRAGGGPGDDYAQAVAIQAGGRIVVLGYSNQGPPGDNRFAIARFMSGGGLDPSFSDDGMRTIGFGENTDSADGHDLAIQPNGRIVVLGARFGAGSDIAIARLMPNGSLDRSFAGDGKRTINFGPGLDVGYGMAIQPDGRIVLTGISDQGGATGNDFAIARLMTDGSLDQSFSGDGKRTTTFGPGLDIALAVAIDSNGRIVAIGSSDVTGPKGDDFAIVRYLSGGGLDQSFSDDGKRTTAFGPDSERGEDVAIQPDGRIVVAGSAYIGHSAFALARYTEGGSLDQSFAGDGKRTTTFGPANHAGEGVALQPDGKIVVVGSSEQSVTGGDFAVARHLPGGGLDQSFSGDGKRTAAFGPGYDTGEAVAIQPNGRIVVAGSAPQATVDFAVARFLVGGGLDQNFSGNGKLTLDF